MRKAVLLLCLIGLTMTLHLQADSGAQEKELKIGGQYSIRAHSVRFLAVNQGKVGILQVFPLIYPGAIWVIEEKDDSYLIRNKLGGYLSSTGKQLDPVSLQPDSSKPGSSWQAEELDNGRWIFTAEDGSGYLRECLQSPPSKLSFPCTNKYNPLSAPRAQWVVEEIQR